MSRPEASPTRRVIRSELRSYLWTIIAAVGCMLVAAALSLLQPLFHKSLFDDAIPTSDSRTILTLLLAMVAAPIAGIAMNYTNDYLRIRVGEHVAQALRRTLFEHAIRLRTRELESFTSAGIVFRIKTVAGRIGEMYVAQELLPVTLHGISLVGALIAMLYIDEELATVACISIPISWAVTEYASLKSRQRDRDYLSHRQRGAEQITEVLDNIRLVKSFQGEGRERERWDTWIGRDIHLKLKSAAFHHIVISFPNDIINNLVVGLVLGLGAFRIVDNTLSLGSLIALAGYAPRTYAALKGILRTVSGTRRVSVSIEQLDEVFRLETESQSLETVASIDSTPTSIAFEDVSFDHGRGGGVRDLSFRVEPGESLAIVGPSGGGKTTVLDLLLGFYEPDAGRITLGGRDLNERSVDDIRRHITWIPQDGLLWNASILDNVTYPEAHDTQTVRQATTLAGLDSLLERLPDGVGTSVGVGGRQLSGGERQRLALARASLRESSILLVDEGTSALDAESERDIHEAFDRIRRGRTTIVVAHRFSTIRSVDRILVLDERGRMAEIGTQPDLIAADGLFRKLWDAQDLTQWTR